MGCGGSRNSANNAAGAPVKKPDNKVLGPSADKGRAESATVSISGVDLRGNSATSQRSLDSGIGSTHGSGSPADKQAKTEKMMEELSESPLKSFNKLRLTNKLIKLYR